MTAPEKPQALTIDEALMDASLWPRQHLAVDVKLEFRENGLFAWADLYGIPERPVRLTYVPLTPEGAESITPTQLVAQLLSQALGRPVVERRDDTAELVEAVDTFLSRLEDFLGATGAVLEAWESGTGPNVSIPVYRATAARLATSGGKLRAALARVGGGERS